ncbi:hypothetical protein [Luteococcus sanguinis]|uniref:Uncharacterized protein n=1 Tax=Luteococcus sanguinis TaxID=174038 RepID=A0ABW1X348_9ACTN
MTNTATVDLDELNRLLRHRTGHGLADLLERLLDDEAPAVATTKDPAVVVALRILTQQEGVPLLAREVEYASERVREDFTGAIALVTGDVHVIHDRQMDLRTRRARGHYRPTASTPIPAEA